MKCLILSCNTGQGHNSAGKAIVNELKERGIECEMLDVLCFGKENTSKIVSRTYNRITTKAPWVFSLFFQLGNILGNNKSKSVIYYANAKYADKLYHYIVENKYDTIICTHLFPSESITYIRSKYPTDFKTYYVATDYSCTPLSEETNLDYYFIPHQELKREYIDKGIPEHKIICTGIPVHKRFKEKLDKKEAKKTLGINEDDHLILIMTGIMGFGNIILLIKKFLKIIDDNIHIFVLTGTNDKLKEQIERKFKGNHNIKAVSFTNKVSTYMDACDILLSKPGGLSSTEAAVKNIPLIHTAGIPGGETLNAYFFNQKKCSIYTKNIHASQIAYELLNNEKAQNEILYAQSININRNAAEDICDFISV